MKQICTVFSMLLLLSAQKVSASEFAVGDLWPLKKAEVEETLFLPARLCIEPDSENKSCRNAMTLEPAKSKDAVTVSLTSSSYAYPMPGIKVIARFDAEWESSRLCFTLDQSSFEKHSLHRSTSVDTDTQDNPLPETEQSAWRIRASGLNANQPPEKACMRFFVQEGDRRNNFVMQEIEAKPTGFDGGRRGHAVLRLDEYKTYRLRGIE